LAPFASSVVPPATVPPATPFASSLIPLASLAAWPLVSPAVFFTFAGMSQE
jgi:hypothetical protein